MEMELKRYLSQFAMWNSSSAGNPSSMIEYLPVMLPLSDQYVV